MVTLARHHDECDNISWLTDVQPADLILYADESLISQVMINLLKNAQQAIGSRYKKQNDLEQTNDYEPVTDMISITASCKKSESIIIEISNNGPAIPEEEVAHIFIPFFTTKEYGSGVGLSIVRQIMRLSGGSITHKKDHSSGLTTFTLTFP